MIVTAPRAAGDGGCSTPVQIRAQLSREEEGGPCMDLLAQRWHLSLLVVVGDGVNLRSGAMGGGSREDPLPSW